MRRFLEGVWRIVLEARDDNLHMLSLGIVLTFWSGSNIFAALTDGLNAMYDVDEGRSWWAKRGLAVVLLVVGAGLGSSRPPASTSTCPASAPTGGRTGSWERSS